MPASVIQAVSRKVEADEWRFVEVMILGEELNTLYKGNINMKWITFENPVGKYTKGQTVSLDDGIADAYIETKSAKLGTAPATSTEVSLSTTELEAIAAKAVDGVIAKLAPQGKRITFADIEPKPVTKVWAQVRSGRMKHLPNTDAGREVAFRVGNWFSAVVARSLPGYAHLHSSIEWCEKNGLGFETIAKAAGAQSESVNQAGGFLVPTEFDNQIIDLREKYGVIRQSIAMTRMAGDTLLIPRRLNGATAYFTAENSAISQSTLGWDQVQLVAKKLAAIVYTSSELNADAMVNIGDTIAGEIAYAFALKEDQCGFIGDGTATYGGITGVGPKIFGLNATKANILGLQVGAAGTGAAWSGFTLADFNSTIGRLPQYAYTGGNARWYTSQQFWASTMQRLATAAGGNRVDNIVNGVRQLEFLGAPVTITQVMPSVAATNSVVALFGDLGEAASFGDRMMTSIMVTNTGGNTFANDQIAVRGTERFDFVCHDVGQCTGDVPRDPTVGLQAGPIVALATAAS
jgi:HK97 family phage major capsid protein